MAVRRSLPLTVQPTPVRWRSPGSSHRRPLPRHSQLATLLAAGAILLGALPAVTVASTTAIRPQGIPGEALGTPPNGPVLVRGAIKTKHNKTTHGRVAVFAWPKLEELKALPGEAKVVPLLVGWGATDESGQFAIHSDAARIPKSYYSDDGGLNVQIEAWNDRARGTWMHTAGGDTDRSADVATATAKATSSDTGAFIKIKLTGKLVPASDDAPTASTGDVVAAAMPLPDVPGNCWWTKSSLASVKHQNNLVSVWPRVNKWKVAVTSAHKITSQAALSAGTSWGSFSASGSWATTAGASFSTSSSYTAYNFYGYELYHRYLEQCTSAYGGGIDDIRNLYLPEGPTLDTSYAAASFFPSSKTSCANISLPAGSTWKRSTSSTSTASLSGALKTSSVIGINLSITSAFAATSSDKYDVIATIGTAMWICGDTSDQTKWNIVYEPRSNP